MDFKTTSNLYTVTFFTKKKTLRQLLRIKIMRNHTTLKFEFCKKLQPLRVFAFFIFFFFVEKWTSIKCENIQKNNKLMFMKMTSRRKTLFVFGIFSHFNDVFIILKFFFNTRLKYWKMTIFKQTKTEIFKKNKKEFSSKIVFRTETLFFFVYCNDFMMKLIFHIFWRFPQI